MPQEVACSSKIVSSSQTSPEEISPGLSQAHIHFQQKDYRTACRLALENTPSLAVIDQQNLKNLIFALDLQISCHLQIGDNKAARMISSKLVDIVDAQPSFSDSISYRSDLRKRHIEILCLAKDSTTNIEKHVDALLSFYRQSEDQDTALVNIFELADLLHSNNQLDNCITVTQCGLDRLQQDSDPSYYNIAFHTLLAECYHSKQQYSTAVEHANLACTEFRQANPEDLAELTEYSATTPTESHRLLIELCSDAYVYGSDENEQQLLLAINIIKQAFGNHSEQYIESLWQYANALSKTGHANQAKKVADIAQSLNFENLVRALPGNDSIPRDTLLLLNETPDTLRTTLYYYESELPTHLEQAYIKSLIQIAEGMYNHFRITGKDVGLAQAFTILDFFTNQVDRVGRVSLHHRHAKCLSKLGQIEQALEHYAYAIRHTPEYEKNTVILLLESAELLINLKSNENNSIDWQGVARKINIAFKVAEVLDPNQKNIISAKCLLTRADLQQMLFENVSSDEATELYQENIACLKQALKIFKDQGHTKAKDFIRIYSLLGNAYHELGEYRKSDYYFSLASNSVD